MKLLLNFKMSVCPHNINMHAFPSLPTLQSFAIKLRIIVQQCLESSRSVFLCHTHRTLSIIQPDAFFPRCTQWIFTLANSSPPTALKLQRSRGGICRCTQYTNETATITEWMCFFLPLIRKAIKTHNRNGRGRREFEDLNIVAARYISCA